MHHYNAEISNLFDPELQLISNEPVIKSKFLKQKKLLSEVKKFNVQKILVLHYLKRNNCKMFHPSTKLITSDSDIDETFKFIYQSIMKKIKIMPVKIPFYLM